MENKKLAHNLVKEEIKYFPNGKCYSYYTDKLRYIKNDTWISKEQWILMAENLILKWKSLNVVSLEILLSEKFDKYYPLAQDFVKDWKTLGYDISLYYNLVALFPQEHFIRKELFNIDDFKRYLLSYSYNNLEDYDYKIMLESLVRANDSFSCQKIAKFLDKQIKLNAKKYELLERLIPMIIHLDRYAVKYISRDSLKILKKFVSYYLYQDKKIIYEELQYQTLEDKRSLWIMDEIAPIAYALKWYDILDYLLKEGWYWIYIFDDECYYEEENKNLLTWSLYASNQTLKARAVEVMNNNYFNRVDGAIAFFRFELLDR